MTKTKSGRFICVRRSAPIEGRIYSPGEELELPEGAEAPDGFMPMTVRGFHGEVSTGPFFFALKDCTVGNDSFRRDDLWPYPAFKKTPPETLFAPLAEREGFTVVQEGNGKVLRRKPAPPEYEVIT